MSISIYFFFKAKIFLRLHLVTDLLQKMVGKAKFY